MDGLKRAAEIFSVNVEDLPKTLKKFVKEIEEMEKIL